MKLISWFKNDSSEAENNKARRAFETVLILAVKQPDTDRYQDFSDQVNALQAKTNNESVPKEKFVSFERLFVFTLCFHRAKVNPYVATFYDAVLLYVYGLNRTIQAKENTSDGFAVVQRMWNVSFEGSNGIVQISETGDRVSDYSLFDLNPKSGLFEVTWLNAFSGEETRFDVHRK